MSYDITLSQNALSVALSQVGQQGPGFNKVASVSGTTPNLDVANGNVFTLTTSGNTTVTLTSGASSGFADQITLVLTTGGTHTMDYTSNQTVLFPGGVEPLAPADGETDFITFISLDQGTTWYGFPGGYNFA